MPGEDDDLLLALLVIAALIGGAALLRDHTDLASPAAEIEAEAPGGPRRAR